MEMQLPPRLKKALPHLVAAFLVVHVVSMSIEVIPDLRVSLNRKAWQEPRVSHELDRWARRLHLSREQFEEIAFTIGSGITSLRQALRTPFRPYLALSGQKQTWAMFVAGSRFRDRFQIRARTCRTNDTSCDWEVLYFRNDPAHDYMKGVLENARVRSGTFRWGWPQGQKSYQRGCQAISHRLFAERPDVMAVECRFEQTPAPDPRKPDAPIEAIFSRERTERRP